MNRITNQQTLEYPDVLLSDLDKQRRFLIREYGRAMPCPSCGAEVRCWEARGVEFNDYDFGNSEDSNHSCPSCHRPLKRAVYFVGGWDWQIDHEKEEGKHGTD